MVSGSLALLYFLLGFHGGRQSSGPNRGQSPVEWGDFLSVGTFICPSIPPLWASGLAGWALGLAGWASGLAGFVPIHPVGPNSPHLMVRYLSFKRDHFFPSQLTPCIPIYPCWQLYILPQSFAKLSFHEKAVLTPWPLVTANKFQTL